MNFFSSIKFKYIGIELIVMNISNPRIGFKSIFKFEFGFETTYKNVKNLESFTIIIISFFINSGSKEAEPFVLVTTARFY